MCVIGESRLASRSLPQEGVSYEVRRYDGAKYASVSSEGRTFDQVTGELVRKLLVYIGGSNDQGEPIREQGLSCQSMDFICGHIFNEP